MAANTQSGDLWTGGTSAKKSSVSRWGEHKGCHLHCKFCRHVTSLHMQADNVGGSRTTFYVTLKILYFIRVFVLGFFLQDPGGRLMSQKSLRQPMSRQTSCQLWRRKRESIYDGSTAQRTVSDAVRKTLLPTNNVELHLTHNSRLFWVFCCC